MNIFRTIRMRFTIIYFILVLSSLILIGVFILRSFEGYSLRSVDAEIDDISYVIQTELSKISDKGDVPHLVKRILTEQFKFGSKVEVFVIDSFLLEIIASNTTYNELSELDENLLVRALDGEIASEDQTSINFSFRDKVYPSQNGEYITYIRYNMSDHQALIAGSKRIIARAIVLAIVMTSIISALVSKSITDPINSLTKQVKQLALGDFNQVVDVHTDDEIGTFSDTFNYLVSEINQRMERVTEEKNKVETITRNIGEGLIAISSTGKIIHSNSKAYEMIAVKGKIDAEELLEICRRDDQDVEVIEKRGRYMQLSFAEFTEQNERGVIVAIQDITKQQKIDQMRKDFIANVSHELKTPLTSVISYAETIIDSENMDDETRNKFLDVIVSESERMTRLVKDLLYLSSIDSSNLALRYCEVNIAELIDKCVENLAISLEQKNQRVMFKHRPTIVATVDRDQMEQLVLNILSNAIKYSSEKSKIHISLKNDRVDDEESFKIQIKDEGPGISEEDLSRIFERFYRVDKARSRAMGGTGLGLSIAKGIVEAHGGEIFAESKLGEGTKIIMNIPMEPNFEKMSTSVHNV